MPILTPEEARGYLDYTTIEDMPSKVTDILLPAIDNYIRDGTGKDWGVLTETYTTIDPVAKLLAGVLLVRWFEDPGLIGETSDITVLSLISQLEAKFLVEKQEAEEVV